MFTGTVESKSHEGGLLVHFDGSSPALNAIMVRADDGTYIGKVDGVIGSTDRPLAHVAHVDRSLDMDALVGVSVTVRAKKKPTEQRHDRGNRDRRGDDRRQDGRDRQGFRGNQGGDRRFDQRRQGGRDNRHRNDQRTFDDWTCPQCNNSNFARRTVCNRCEAPRPGGGQRNDRGNTHRGPRDNNRGFRNDRGGRDSRGNGRPQ
ncbi:MAG: zinc finger protein, partial [Candidatus Thermoplasmatota archaeon]|nr:zinc finger protein [Candidatus Thermoplasmatota archaeon]